MKYEASRNNATETTLGTGTIPKSVPNVKAWISINVSTMFTYARDAYNKNGNLNTTLNSHMMKNSEWGAVLYLTESKYGRNGTEISMNQCSDRITGTVGQLSSTTGNIYGIYDISGGTITEYVMGFYQDENGNIYTGQLTAVNTGFNGFLGEGTEKTDGIEFPVAEKKYYQLYQKDNLEGMYYLGDALYETRQWYSAGSGFVSSYIPVFGRDIFAFTNYGGQGQGIGFRLCMAIK